LRPVAWLLLALTVPACSLPRSPTMAAVPPEWRHGNPFGPEANAARACGMIHVQGQIRRAAEWTAFAQAHIESGDLLFRRGRNYTLKGRLTTCVLAGANDGRFSHVGLARWEDDGLWVYDVESEGVRKVPYLIWMLDVSGDNFAVKRVRPEHRHCIPAALDFCEDAYQRHCGFNFALRPTEGRYYCSEMVETSYRAAGLVLSDPIPVYKMAGYRRVRFLVPLVELFMGVDRTVPVFALGNEHYGTFASPQLETVYEGPEPDRPERGLPLSEKVESE
jgi:hypothetical protein